jgi:predicted nucleic acid-binding protein
VATSTYIDTSAVAKWYLDEPRSAEVEAFIVGHAPIAISTLTLVEMRCLLARRRRRGEIDVTHEMRVFATFEGDIRQGHLIQYPVDDHLVAGAPSLITSLPDHSLRSLDALHLSIALNIGAEVLATADLVMAAAAEALALRVARFC